MKTFKKITLTILGVVGIGVTACGLTAGLFIWILYVGQGHTDIVDAPAGYYKEEEYFDQTGLQDFTDYCKYYYKVEDDYIFENDEEYFCIKEDDIPDIIGYFEDFECFMLPERADEYDFDISQITVGDYIRIESQVEESEFNPDGMIYFSYDVYLYDIETHILYYIHNNL